MITNLEERTNRIPRAAQGLISDEFRAQMESWMQPFTTFYPQPRRYIGNGTFSNGFGIPDRGPLWQRPLRPAYGEIRTAGGSALLQPRRYVPIEIIKPQPAIQAPLLQNIEQGTAEKARKEKSKTDKLKRRRARRHALHIAMIRKLQKQAKRKQRRNHVES